MNTRERVRKFPGTKSLFVLGEASGAKGRFWNPWSNDFAITHPIEARRDLQVCLEQDGFDLAAALKAEAVNPTP